MILRGGSESRHSTREIVRAMQAGLSAAGRARFDQRVVELVYEKDWIGRDLTVTREMKVRIAGAIAQVTFGFAKAGEYDYPVGAWNDHEFILRRG